MLFQLHANDVERHGEQKDGPAEMVGYDDGSHYGSATVEEQGEHQGVKRTHLQHLTENAVEEDERVECGCHQQQRHENHGKVNARGRHEPLVEPIEGGEDKSKERVARNLEINLVV